MNLERTYNLSNGEDFLFPSPTGVNYYESSLDIEYLELYVTGFPSPTGVNYYECEERKSHKDD